MRYAWIHTQRDCYPLNLLCRVLQVSRSGYYAWCRRPPSARAQRRQEIARAAQRSHGDSHGTYGYRRVHRDLIEDHQVACCRETVRHVMGDLGLCGRHKRRFVKTTDSNHDEPIATNRLQRDFAATRPNQKWLADITYIRLVEGWLYLAVVLDCFSRRIVGWSLSRTIDASLVCAALEMALRRRCPQDDLVHHSDRGVQYASQAFRDLLTREGLTMSMSRKGDPWDNAMMESFFGSLKTEWIDSDYATEEQARREVFKYIEMFYNPTRRHSALGYLSPAEYERRYEAGPLTPMDEAA
ncbi:MAG TPA: IS3 family transposase [Sedimentisphaerales bacterium]|nr:IS3 family transposase [Sedimentisphaerales bacterium]HRV46399.1 IS3 family transposase [Sedimentisphaerales bacterium]